MKIAQINMVHFSSTGKIMLQIAQCAREFDIEMQTYSTCLAAKRPVPLPKAPNGHIYYGSYIENVAHVALARLTGGYGLFSRFSTYRLIQTLKKFKPDAIHLHNLHAAYINLPMLFRYINDNEIPIIWTLHDCWTFTGKCAYFESVKCEKWKTGCNHCPQLPEYPKSYLDTSKLMFRKKKEWFTSVPNMTLVTPSNWLAGLVQESFLGKYPVKVINNGIDLSVFRPVKSDFRNKYHCEDKFILLGVAFGWDRRKGLDVFLELANRLDETYQIVLVGTDERIDAQLPKNVISIHRTENQQELAEIYSAADLFVNPTREENYPTVNMEAIACGTPVLTFRTGGSPEIPDETCGCVVDCDDVDAFLREIHEICAKKPYSVEACLDRAKRFDMNTKYREYVELYRELF